jgi:hypothetical protein
MRRWAEGEGKRKRRFERGKIVVGIDASRKLKSKQLNSF